MHSSRQPRRRSRAAHGKLAFIPPIAYEITWDSADGRQITVAVLCEDWLRQHSGDLSRNTHDLRTWAVRLHLVPALARGFHGGGAVDVCWSHEKCS